MNAFSTFAGIPIRDALRQYAGDTSPWTGEEGTGGRTGFPVDVHGPFGAEGCSPRRTGFRFALLGAAHAGAA